MRWQVALATIFCAVLAAVHVSGIDAGMTGHEPSGRTVQKRVPSVSAASEFLSRIIRLLTANNYAAAWAHLDPVQQRLVPQPDYIRCESASPIPGRLAQITAVRTERRRVVVPGTRSPARPAIAVTFRLRFEALAADTPVVTTVKAHALSRNGVWRWMLSSQRLALHRSGHCGQPPVTGEPRT